MAVRDFSQLVALTFLVAILAEVVTVRSGRRYDIPTGRLREKQNAIVKRSFRGLRGMSYLPLDKIGGGVVLRELDEEEPSEESNLSLRQLEREANKHAINENLNLGKSNSQSFPLLENSVSLDEDSVKLKRKPREAKVTEGQEGKIFDVIDQYEFNNIPKRNLGNSGMLGSQAFDKRNFDEIDRAGFRNMGKRNFDEIDRAGFRNMGKRNFDEIDRAGFHNLGKRNFDEIDRAGFHNLGKRNFDEIDRAGFHNLGKRNFDEIDRAGFRSMGKRNFDEIDRAGFRSMGKRNFDEIDRAGFHNLGKRNFDEIDRSGFGNIGKRDFDEIDRSGFSSIGKRNFLKFEKPDLSDSFTDKFSFSNIKNDDAYGYNNMANIYDLDMQKSDKRNFDEIDRSGFGNIDKRNFDEIDRSGFGDIGKRNFDEIDRSGFGNIGKRNFDEIDRSGFSHIGKRQVETAAKVPFTKSDSSHSNERKEYDSLYNSAKNAIGSLLKTTTPEESTSFPSIKEH